jgi:hypothetical protein
LGAIVLPRTDLPLSVPRIVRQGQICPEAEKEKSDSTIVEKDNKRVTSKLLDISKIRFSVRRLFLMSINLISYLT